MKTGTFIKWVAFPSVIVPRIPAPEEGRRRRSDTEAAAIGGGVLAARP